MLGKKSFGEPYACKQTTALASLAHSIRGEATKESENRSLLRQEKEKLQASSVEAFLGGEGEIRIIVLSLIYKGFQSFDVFIMFFWLILPHFFHKKGTKT